MECLLGAICLYVDLAVGAHRNRDAEIAFDGPIPERIERPSPLGRFQAGAEWASPSRRVGAYFEVEHHSSFSATDWGFNGAWVGTRLRW